MPEILKISIALTGAQIAILKSAVNKGEYATTSEAVREALREWNHKRGLRKIRPKTRHKIKSRRRAHKKTRARSKRRRR